LRRSAAEGSSSQKLPKSERIAAAFVEWGPARGAECSAFSEYDVVHMTEDRALLRYSDRQALADGSFGPLRHTEVPDAFRVALAAVVDQMKKQPPAGQTAYYALTNHFRQHFGLREEWPDIWLTYNAPATQDVLDFLELLIEEATK